MQTKCAKALVHSTCPGSLVETLLFSQEKLISILEITSTKNYALRNNKKTSIPIRISKYAGLELMQSQNPDVINLICLLIRMEVIP